MERGERMGIWEHFGQGGKGTGERKWHLSCRIPQQASERWLWLLLSPWSGSPVYQLVSIR